MTDEFVAIFKKQLNFAFGMFEKFLQICPENIWNSVFGGRPVSQQYYHALGATALYLESISGEKIVNRFPDIIDPFPEKGIISPNNESQPKIEEARNFLCDIKQSARRLFQNLDDKALLQKDDMASDFIGVILNNGAVLSIITGHMLYHLGSCDAALRSQGITGAFSGIGAVKQMFQSETNQPG